MFQDTTDPGSKPRKIHVENIEISQESKKLRDQLLTENPGLKEILLKVKNIEQLKRDTRHWIMDYLRDRTDAFDYYYDDITGKDAFDHLNWKDVAAIRILDYIDYEGKEYQDLNLRGSVIINAPLKTLWLAVKNGRGGGTPDFFKDMIQLFRQFEGRSNNTLPSKDQVEAWMNNYPSGLDPDVIEARKVNRDRIIKIFIEKIDNGDIQRRKFGFEPEWTYEQKYEKMLEWWNDRMFHLQFAVRSPERLSRLMGRTIDPDTMEILFEAQDSGIPIFVNPYYLSLLDIEDRGNHADQAIRDYVFVSESLVKEFGNIVAWEKEDIVEPGKPNAAGWILPHRRNIHRRYPEVAILIPDTTGRACGGLCVSCQRMYDFQNGHLNFDLEELKSVDSWWERLPKLLRYYENDAQLRDILITGGDALMTSDRSLKRILDEVYQMAIKKRANNRQKAVGEKYAEMLRVRLGTRLPVYLPQRITDDLIVVLKDFKEKASEIGIKQFVIQTHFESAMEVTPESAAGIRKLISAGWTVTNQLVFTAPASRRGHTAKLRKVLNDIGVISYYTFTVKGYRENSFMFANNARAVQEQIEEKYIGLVPEEYHGIIKKFPMDAANMIENIDGLREKCNIPFLATDRNVINLPGVGKSLTFRTVGITHDGRRILEFDHDHTRTHSPIINKMGKVIIIESRSISDYLNRLKEMGENTDEYESIWGYSIGETEPRMPVYEYPSYKFQLTEEFTNLEI